MKINFLQKISILYFLGMILFWLFLFFTKTQVGPYNFLFSFLMGILPFVVGVFSIIKSKIWEGNKDLFKKGVFFLGLGLFSWGCGELIWSYYNVFLGVGAPYPSIADVGFAPSVFFYCIGVIYLSKATGAKFGLNRPFAQLFIIIAPVIMFMVSYFLLVVFARQGNLLTEGDSALKSILDVLYPVGDFLSLTIAIIISGLSFKSILHEYKFAILPLMFGLASMFVSDSVFSYTTSRGTYFNGNFGDLLFTFSLSLLSFGVLSFVLKTNEN